MFLLFGLLGIPIILLTPPPSAEFVELCLKRDAYRAATHQPPILPTPTHLFWVSRPGEVPAGAHPATGRLAYHQIGEVQALLPRYYGLRVPLPEGGEVWAEARLTPGYYQMASSATANLRLYLGLAIFYLLLLGMSSRVLGRIRGRLAALGQAAQRLAQGDLSTTCASDARDPSELALLVSRLHEMGAALRDRHQQLSERRQQLEQESTERNRRLAEVSHDLRTPLTSILGYAQLYHDQGLPRLSVVESQGKALLERVGRWLEACRLESGVLELQLGEVHLHDVLEEAFHLAQQARPLEARVELPLKSPVVEADGFLLPRILARLILHLNCRQIRLRLESSRLILTGDEPVGDDPDPAQVSLETCRTLLRRHRIRLDLGADRVELSWELPWGD